MIASEHFTPIAELDLEPIKVKLMHEESGEGWSLDKVNAVEFEYRRFLYLMKMFPNEQTAPLMDVDTFWHYHILDTMKYAVDCENVFGYFLHHFPYIGLRGEDDVAAHRRVGDRMKELYEETFGEAYVRNTAPAYSGAIGTKPGAAETAYSGAVSAATAYSGAATAYSGAATAYSGAATAYSGAISAATAYSGAATAYSGAATAYSGAATASPGRIGTESAYSGRIAYSGSASEPATAAKTAYSGRIGTGTAGGAAAAVENAFYSERPRLA